MSCCPYNSKTAFSFQSKLLFSFQKVLRCKLYIRREPGPVVGVQYILNINNNSWSFFLLCLSQKGLLQQSYGLRTAWGYKRERHWSFRHSPIPHTNVSEQKDQYIVATLAVCSTHWTAFSCYWPFMNKYLKLSDKATEKCWHFERDNLWIWCWVFLTYLHLPSLAAIWEEVGNKEISILWPK